MTLCRGTLLGPPPTGHVRKAKNHLCSEAGLRGRVFVQQGQQQQQ